MSEKKQIPLLKDLKTTKEFGGSRLKKSNPKTSRPLSTKNAIHITMRSSMAKGTKSLLYGRSRTLRIQKTVGKQAQCFGVVVYKFANVGNHIHLLVRIHSRKMFLNFLRALSGIIARIVLGAEKGAKKGIKFWDQRPWTRVVIWMRDFINVRKYVEKNFNQALGFVEYMQNPPDESTA